jgi:hypothetical protein
MPNPFLDPAPRRSSPSISDRPPTLPQIHVSPTLSPIVGRSNGNTTGGESERRFEPPSGPPPPASGSSSSSSSHSGGGSRRLEADDLDAEAPPAYTPAADVYQGESTLEVGPRRPFQQVPAQRRPPPAQQQQQQQHLAPPSEWDQYQRHTRQGQWAQSNPSLVSHPSGSASPGWGPPNSAPNSNADLPPPPPRHPHSQNSIPNRAASEAPVSDFARDFYAAGGGDVSESQSQSQSSSSNANRYAPPSGPPPPQSSNNGTNKKKAAGEEISDDGRPTHVPTPGHPLLLNSKLLVYPVGFECHKCACSVFFPLSFEICIVRFSFGEGDVPVLGDPLIIFQMTIFFFACVCALCRTWPQKAIRSLVDLALRTARTVYAM